MSDTLKILDKTFSGVKGFRALNESNNTMSYTRDSWELINTFTPSEDVNLINVNTDSNGNNFSLTKCLVIMTAQASNTTNNNNKMSIAFSLNGSGANVDITNCSDLNYANQQTFAAYCETNGLFKYVRYSYSNPKVDSSTDYAQYNSSKDVSIYKIYNGTITNFAVRVNTSTITFDSTKTTINIYGVRA